MSVVYGTVRFALFGHPAVAELTDSGWKCRQPAGADIDEVLDALASPSDFGPADGDPTAAAVMEVARALRGTYELAELPGAEAGALY